MENTELIKLLDNEMERVALVLRATRPESNDYCSVLDNMRNLFWFKDAMSHSGPEVPVMEPVRVEQTRDMTIATCNPVENEVTTITFRPAECDSVGTECDSVGTASDSAVVSETVEISYEDLRAAVKEKAASGKPMQPVIEKYVPDGKPVKLSSVPKARYAELMKELNNAG